MYLFIVPCVCCERKAEGGPTLLCLLAGYSYCNLAKQVQTREELQTSFLYKGEVKQSFFKKQTILSYHNFANLTSSPLLHSYFISSFVATN